MPFKPSAPPTHEVPSTIEQVCDTYHIVSVRIETPVDGARRVEVWWAEGYMEGGAFVAAVTNSAMCEGEAFEAKIAQTVQSGETFYAAVKRGIWEYLQEQKLIGAGSVS